MFFLGRVQMQNKEHNNYQSGRVCFLRIIQERKAIYRLSLQGMRRKENLEMDDWRCRFQQEPIDNRPHFIMGGRQSGKQYGLLKKPVKQMELLFVLHIIWLTMYFKRLVSLATLFQSLLHTINCLCTLITQIRTLTTLTNTE